MKKHHFFLGMSLALATLLGTITGVMSAKASFTHDLFVTQVSAAQQNPDPREQLLDAGVGFSGSSGSEATPKDPRFIIAGFVRTALTFVGISLVIVTMYAGYLWWSAGGNDEKVKKAKATLRNALIGLIIVALSYGIVSYLMFAILQSVAGTPGYFSPNYR